MSLVRMGPHGRTRGPRRQGAGTLGPSLGSRLGRRRGGRPCQSCPWRGGDDGRIGDVGGGGTRKVGMVTARERTIVGGQRERARPVGWCRLAEGSRERSAEGSRERGRSHPREAVRCGRRRDLGSGSGTGSGGSRRAGQVKGLSGAEEPGPPMAVGGDGVDDIAGDRRRQGSAGGVRPGCASFGAAQGNQVTEVDPAREPSFRGDGTDAGKEVRRNCTVAFGELDGPGQGVCRGKLEAMGDAYEPRRRRTGEGRTAAGRESR